MAHISTWFMESGTVSKNKFVENHKLLFVFLAILLVLPPLTCPVPVQATSTQYDWAGVDVQPPASPDLGDFNFSQTVRITNNSDVNWTDPVIEIPIIPYETVARGSYTVTHGNGTAYTYNIAIPFDVREISDTNLTNYTLWIQHVPALWLSENNWTTVDGQEVCWVHGDNLDANIPYADLLRWYLPNLWQYGWDTDDAEICVEGNFTAYDTTRLYMLIDADLTGVTRNNTNTKYTDDIYDYHDDMTSGENNWAIKKTYEIASNSHDAYRYYRTAWGFSSSSDVCPFGRSLLSGVHTSWDSAFTFSSVDIPQGTTVLRALLIFNSYADIATDTVRTRIRAEDSDDATPVTDWNSPPWNSGKDDPQLTSASRDWNFTTDWFEDYWYSTHARDMMAVVDVSNIVNEVVGRVGWSSGNKIQFFVFNDNSTNLAYRSPSSRNDSASESAELVVWSPTSTITAGSHTVSNTNFEPDYMISDDTFTPPCKVRIVADVDGDFGEDQGNVFGLSSSGSGAYARFADLNNLANDWDEAIQVDDTGTTNYDDQAPFPTGSIASWDILWRGDIDAVRSEWARFLANQVQLYIDSPLWTNVPTSALRVFFYGFGDRDIVVYDVIVSDYNSPEPIVNFPFIHHHPNTIFLENRSEHWLYDSAFAKTGNTTELYYCPDDRTLSVDYATIFKVKYIGTINSGAYADIDYYYGNAAQSTQSAYWNCSQVADYWDDFNAGDDVGWSDATGSWGVSNQQRPQIEDQHLMKYDEDASNIWVASAPWTDNDGIDKFIAIAGSHETAGVAWSIPWENVLYEKIGNQWYRWGNIMTCEYDGCNHASLIGYITWEGDGSYMGNSSWIYWLAQTTNVATGDSAAFIYVSKDKSGYKWEVLNDGYPIWDYRIWDNPVGTNRGRFNSLVYNNGDYVCSYGHLLADGWDGGFCFASDAGDINQVRDILYGNQTSPTTNPSTIWDDGGIIFDVSDGDMAEVGGIEAWFIYEQDDGDWVGMMEAALAGDVNPDFRDFYYSECSDANMDGTMIEAQWSVGANPVEEMEDCDTVYEWSYNNFATAICNIDTYPAMVHAGYAERSIARLAFADSSTLEGNSFTMLNVDYERRQTENTAEFKLSTVTGNKTAGTIQATVSAALGDDTYEWAGIIWRYTDVDNFCIWFIDETAEKFAYGYKIGGVWTGYTAKSAGYNLSFGMEYDLRVTYNGSNTTLDYRRQGWEWKTAYDGVLIADGDLVGGKIGMGTWYIDGYFDDFFYCENPIIDFSVEGQGSSVTVQTDAATNITPTTATLNGQITAGAGVATIGFILSETSITPAGAPTDYTYYWTENSNAPYGIGSYSANTTDPNLLNPLASGEEYFTYIAAQEASYPNAWYWDVTGVSFLTLLGWRPNASIGVILGPF